MGDSGQVDTTVANNANTALYTIFTFFSVLGRSIYNILGPQLTVFSGCLIYVLYTGSFPYYNHYKDQTFAIFTRALRSRRRAFMGQSRGNDLAYPSPRWEGTYISLFWSFFNIGGVIVASLPSFLITTYQRHLHQ